MITRPMVRLSQQVFGITLSACFLFVSFALTQNISSHLHHGGHDQQTHEQTWCSWSCQAGQGTAVHSVFIESPFQIVADVHLNPPPVGGFALPAVPTSRGPPLLLT